jgi:PAS domain S-box-containing protein
MQEGAAYCRIILERGKPLDFIYLDVNEAFEKLTGLKNVLGKRVTEVIPGIEKFHPELFEIYGRVALGGRPENFEIHFQPSGAWFSISVYSPSREYFVAVFADISERKRFEQALRESEERYRVIVENCNDLICEIDLDGRYTYLSPNYPAILGYEPAGLLNTNALDLVHPDDLAQVRRKLVLPMSTFIFRHRHRDGSWRWFESTGQHFKNSSGQTRSIVTSRDITGRRETERRLQQLSRATEQSPVSVVITDLNGNIEYVNPKFTQVTGYSCEEAIGKNPSILKSGELAPEVYNDLWQTIKAGGEWHGEFHNRKKNGELFWESASISPITDCDGNVTHFVAVKEDITESRKALMEIKESEERFRQLAENIQGVIWMITPDSSKVLYISPAYEQVWGRSCQSLYDAPMGWLDAIHPEDRERVRENRAAKSVSGSFDEQYRIVRPDGSIRWIHDRSFVIRDASGTVCRIAGIAEDITERKRLDEQVLRTQRMECIGTLAGGVAHDLNNILAPILMAVDVLREDVTPAEHQAVLATIEDCARRGASVVSQVLTFARGVEGDRSPLQLRHLAKDVEKMIRETFPKLITIVNRVPATLWTVNGDATQLHQVLLNLCINARDAMPRGGALTISGENVELDEIQASMIPEASPVSYAVVEVSDTGIGIPPDIIGKIFDPFFTTKEFGKGTGLGLSTLIGIVKSHGGFVTVKSALNKGATFKVFLPACGDEGLAPAPAKPAQSPQGAGETILVVDDESSIRGIAGKVLTHNGYKVLTATNGVDAISCYVKHLADIKVVITDVMMPMLDGVNLARALVKMNPGVKVIASTGQGAEARQSEFKELGVKVILQKPYVTEKLLSALHEIIHEQ